MALQEPSTHSSLTVEKATNRLVDASKVIKRRGDIKDSEKKRVKEAFKLLARGVTTASRGAKQQKLYLDYLKRAQELLGNSAVVLSAVGLGQSAIANTKDRVRVDLPFALKERQDDIVNDVLQGLADSYATALQQSNQSHLFGTSSGDSMWMLQRFVHECENFPLKLKYLSDNLRSSQQLNSQIDDRSAHYQNAASEEPVYLTGDVYELSIEDITTVASADHFPGKILLTDTYKVDTTSFITIPISAELTNQLIRQRPRFM